MNTWVPVHTWQCIGVAPEEQDPTVVYLTEWLCPRCGDLVRSAQIPAQSSCQKILHERTQEAFRYLVESLRKSRTEAREYRVVSQNPKLIQNKRLVRVIRNQRQELARLQRVEESYRGLVASLEKSELKSMAHVNDTLRTLNSMEQHYNAVLKAKLEKEKAACQNCGVGHILTPEQILLLAELEPLEDSDGNESGK